jgi:hypothetical protein
MKTLSLLMTFFLMPYLVAQICNATGVFPGMMFDPDVSQVPIEIRQETLSDLLTYPNCVSACWLGIDPSATEAEVIDILDANGIQYKKHIHDGISGLMDYTVTGGYTHYYVYPGFGGTITIWIVQNASGESGVSVDLVLNNISILDVVKEFGAPTHILYDTAYEANIELIYLGKGLVFSAYDDMVYQVSLRSDEHIVSAYINSPFSKPLTSCTNTLQLCAVATATGVP